MKTVFLVALGSGIGGVARVLAGAAALRLVGDGFPYGTLAVNIAGSFGIGLIAALTVAGRRQISPQQRQFMMAGVCGGFTTYSFFMLETLQLVREPDPVQALLYVAVTLIACVTAVGSGFAVGGGRGGLRRND